MQGSRLYIVLEHVEKAAMWDGGQSDERFVARRVTSGSNNGSTGSLYRWWYGTVLEHDKAATVKSMLNACRVCAKAYGVAAERC